MPKRSPSLLRRSCFGCEGRALQSFSDGALRAGRQESMFEAGFLPLGGTGMTTDA
jgi:hypothetical protein